MSVIELLLFFTTRTHQKKRKKEKQMKKKERDKAYRPLVLNYIPATFLIFHLDFN